MVEAPLVAEHIWSVASGSGGGLWPGALPPSRCDTPVAVAEVGTFKCNANDVAVLGAVLSAATEVLNSVVSCGDDSIDWRADSNVGLAGEGRTSEEALSSCMEADEDARRCRGSGLGFMERSKGVEGELRTCFLRARPSRTAQSVTPASVCTVSSRGCLAKGYNSTEEQRRGGK